MKQGLYEQVVMIRRKDSDNKKENENTKIYNFQRKSAISIRWFHLNHEWREENFRTNEMYFYRKIYQTNIRGNDTKTYQ